MYDKKILKSFLFHHISPGFSDSHCLSHQSYVVLNINLYISDNLFAL